MPAGDLPLDSSAISRMAFRKHDSNMPAHSPWKMVAWGLTLKLVAMWMMLPAVLIPLAVPTHLGIFFAALLPLSIDLTGRCLCAGAPVAERLPLRLSIAAQTCGVLGLSAMSAFLGLVGVVLGLMWAVVLQFAAAKWFIKHLSAIAVRIGQPTIAVGLERLRQRLVTTTLSVYGSGVTALLVISIAVFFGLMAYGIGLVITLPVAFLVVIPLFVSCMVLYFLLLLSYERSLTELRRAVAAWAQTNNSTRSGSGPRDY